MYDEPETPFAPRFPRQETVRLSCGHLATYRADTVDDLNHLRSSTWRGGPCAPCARAIASPAARDRARALEV